MLRILNALKAGCIHIYLINLMSLNLVQPIFPNTNRGKLYLLILDVASDTEFSYPHYAIVLNTKDRKKNDLLTVVPLTSKRKHNTFKEWEHEISKPYQKIY